MTTTQQTTSMKAVAFHQFGNPEVLSVETVPKPSAKSNEVLIKINYTSVNPVDWKIRRGYLKDMFPHHFPIIPGWDAAGVIEFVGADVKDLKPGDRVAAYTRLPEVHSGTYAEYISLPAEFVAKIPDVITFEQAAGVPLVGLTAKQALIDYGSIRKGDKVLVLNGAGGVGSLAIQFAKQLGANVTATTSTRNIDYVRSLGSDQVIDYTKETLLERAKTIAPDGSDFVLDAIGGESLQKSYDLVKANGQLVSIVDTPNAEIALSKKFKANFHFVYPNGKLLTSILNDIAAGKIKLPAHTVMNVKDAIKAQDLSEAHHIRGKIVLKTEF